MGFCLILDLNHYCIILLTIYYILLIWCYLKSANFQFGILYTHNHIYVGLMRMAFNSKAWALHMLNWGICKSIFSNTGPSKISSVVILKKMGFLFSSTVRYYSLSLITKILLKKLISTRVMY